ncbi:MAG: polysaccharide biosynthesis tyrosine autokinase [Crocinitomicaceae bacterium]
MAGDSFFITKDFDAQVVKTVLRRKWWVLLVSILTFTGIAFFILRYSKPVYESTMLIQLADSDQARDLLDIENINSTNSNFNANLELLRSQLLFERALQKMNAHVSLFQEGKILTEEKYTSSCFNVSTVQLKDSSLINIPIYVNLQGNNLELTYDFQNKTKRVKGFANGHLVNEDFDVVLNVMDRATMEKILKNDKLFFAFNSIGSLSSKFSSNLSVNPMDPNAQTIELRFAAYNPYFCADLLNSLANTFFNFELDIKRKGNENVLLFIDQQLDSLSQELENSKDSLVFFQRQSNLADPEAIGSNLTENVIKLQDQLYEIEDELNGLNKVASKLTKEPNRLEIYRLLPEMLGKSYQLSLSKQIEELYEMLERKENLLYSVTEENPEIKSLTLRISMKTEGIRKTIVFLQNRLAENANVLRSKIGSIQNDIFKIPEKKMEYGRLKNIQDLNDKYFSLLTEKKVMYAISNAGYSSSNRILSKAMVQSNPINPNRNQIYGAFIGFGFFFGFIILFIAYVRYNEVNSVDDLKKILPPNLSYLGTVPLLKESMDYSELLVYDSPKSIISEAMRNIRANMSFVFPDYKTIAISSSVSGEGKTFVSLNLAAIIAMSGKKTVLIDLDLRKPKIHLALKASNKIGMSNALVNQKTWQECVQNSNVENLHFLTAGPVPPNPSELILSKKMAEILEELGTIYDVIVIDNPPVGVVSDGVQLLAKADIPIYVFKANYSKRSYAERVEELVDVQHITKLNLILNGEIRNRRSYGYNYEYYSDEPAPKSFLSRIFKI